MRSRWLTRRGAGGGAEWLCVPSTGWVHFCCVQVYMDEGWNVEEGKAGVEESVNECVRSCVWVSVGFARAHWAQCVWEVRVTHLTLWLLLLKNHVFLFSPLSLTLFHFISSAPLAWRQHRSHAFSSTLHLYLFWRKKKKERVEDDGEWGGQADGLKRGAVWQGRAMEGDVIVTVFMAPGLKDGGEVSWLPLTSIISSEWQSVLFLSNKPDGTFATTVWKLLVWYLTLSIITTVALKQTSFCCST